MNFVVLKRNSGKLLVSLLLLAAMLVYLPADRAKADVIYETDRVDYLQVDSPIVLEFDQEIQFGSGITNPSTPNPSFTGIHLFDITDSSSPTLVPIRLEVTGNRLKVIPDPILEPNTDYRLEISADMVTDTSGGFVFDNSPILATNKEVYEFSTYSLSFLDLMRGGGEINDLIEYYTPRQMIVTAPIRYVDEMEVIHRQRGMNGTDTESVMNLNIELDDPAPNRKVARIVVKAHNQEKELNYLNITSARASYDFAFAGLPDRGYDIKVDVYNSFTDEDEENLLDSRVIKVAPAANKATTIERFL